MAARSPAPATPADLEALPENVVGEIIAGELFTQARPRGTHAGASGVLGEELGPPFRRGRGGPGGWILLPEPELWLGSRPDVLVPDLAGWRRERVPTVDVAHFTVAPDWVCEVLSDGTRAHDRVRKVPLYAPERVAHVWLVDPAARTLEVLRLDGDGYRWCSPPRATRRSARSRSTPSSSSSASSGDREARASRSRASEDPADGAEVRP